MGTRSTLGEGRKQVRLDGMIDQNIPYRCMKMGRNKIYK